VISFSELAMHNEPDDCWVALHGTVYDLTSYARRHPSGASIITRLAGTDGTSEYARFHSEPLLASVQVDIVGTLDLATDGHPNNDDPGNSNPPASGCSPLEDSSCVSIQELESHNTADDCWIAIHGNVFDLTKYARSHPAGALVVTELAGTDATNEYRRFHRELLLQSVQDTLVGSYEGGIEVGGDEDMTGLKSSEDSSEDETSPTPALPPLPTDDNDQGQDAIPPPEETPISDCSGRTVLSPRRFSLGIIPRTTPGSHCMAMSMT
jgi:cytochrome b involved in lipid metabolism